MNSTFADYYRCPDQFGHFDVVGELSREEGYFRFRDAICYGRRRGAAVQSSGVTPDLPDLSADVEVGERCVRLPFDLSEVVTNLREERYHQNSQSVLTNARATRTLYYLLRPLLPPSIRKHLQRIALRGWDKIAFPRWPVDFNVETLMHSAMALTLKSSGLQRIPFIWFWPDGASAGVIVTHDVEHAAGQKFCEELMKIDDSFGIKSSFQLVPQERYAGSQPLMTQLRSHGFEVNIHDLNHDGHLFRDRQQFEERAVQINRYAREYNSRGFRSGAMYREQAWYGALDVSYDMSVPNVAHLEPQRGGCCTVMPYFVGKVLELPLTTAQDYSLFFIFGEYSTALWRTQIDLILSRNGLISFITHPDYLIEKRARAVYLELLAHLVLLSQKKHLWIALPREVDCWWRSRSRMTLVEDGASWRVRGEGSERARVAYATLEGDRVVYSVERPA